MITVKELQAFIRSGGFAWPGGYQMALLMSDAESIDCQSARENYRLIRDAMRANDHRSSWHPCCAFIHWEGDPIICAHSNREIPSAYGPTEPPLLPGIDARMAARLSCS
jgi:hypothetical protein